MSFFVFLLQVIDARMVDMYGMGIYDILNMIKEYFLDGRRQDDMASRIPSYKAHVIYIDPVEPVEPVEPEPVERCASGPVTVTVTVTTHLPSTTSHPKPPTCDVPALRDPTLIGGQDDNTLYAANIHAMPNHNVPDPAVALCATNIPSTMPSTGGVRSEALVLGVVAGIILAMGGWLCKFRAHRILGAFRRWWDSLVADAAKMSRGRDVAITVPPVAADILQSTVTTEQADEVEEAAEADAIHDSRAPSVQEGSMGQDELSASADEGSGVDVETDGTEGFPGDEPPTAETGIESRWKGSRTPWSSKTIDTAAGEGRRGDIGGTSSLSAGPNDSERPDIDNTSPGNVASLRQRWELAIQPNFSGEPVPEGIRSGRMQRPKSAPGSVANQKAADREYLDESSANTTGASASKQRYSMGSVAATRASLGRDPASVSGSIVAAPIPLENAVSRKSSISSEGSEPFVRVAQTDADMMTVD